MNYTLKVIRIRQETDDTITICFKQPGLKKIKYLPGQYLTLIFRINGRRYIRPYSFSSCPGVDEFLEITIKRVPGGMVSNHIHDRVKEGDAIEVMPPMGDFTYESEKRFESVYLWGVGSGITPLISIAKYLLNSDLNIKVYLVYGNRTHEATIFLDQLVQLQEKYSNKFHIIQFYTKLVIKEENPFVIQGRIDLVKATSIIGQNDQIENSGHFICGPSGLKESVKTALLSKKVAPDHIYSEDFELIKDPKDFESIHTQTVALNFKEQIYNLEVIKGKSILEAALDADIELPYSCQTGNCSTCKGKLITGETSMIGLSKERNDLDINEYLLCCTYPLTGNVQIQV
ncbi:ferredoxin--NADP reductase [Pedobacter metabolipauper]|uniref:Ring-1,2-phenylacetyl-CoA epoxidase subunit PaaE n=1 Tax=Pedobacter metabolipauper TaxID=425513 RepID=A0A4R6SZ33_9SPHI|nr:ferredoxin--NADP reductase [Pedobacter metabolipauper]TDQ09954.1 ring-1,2-phenylacetyl-CoA epoxidase subunit PaaE [Pedobacter metabolipauper]